MGGRPLPCHGTVSNVLISYRLWKARAMRDRRLDAREAMEGLAILEGMIEPTEELVETVEHVVTCFGGEHGMHSVKADRGWKEKRSRHLERERAAAERTPIGQALLAQVVPFPSTTGGGEAA